MGTTLDHTKFRSASDPQEKKGLSPRDAKSWWRLDDGATPDALKQILTTLRTNQSVLTTQRQLSARLYCNQNPMSYYGLSAGRLLSQSPAARGRLRYNVIKSVCDTVQAKIAKNHPLPLFLTNGAHYKLRRRAQRLSDACKGIFEENRVEETAPQVCMDAELQGSGFIHVYEEFDRVKFERVMADEIWCDELQAFTGLPRSLFRVKHVDRDQLKALFPKHADLIEGADEVKANELGASFASLPIGDLIQVCEAWHLPSGMKKGKPTDDGVHVIAIAEGVLARGAWERPYFPFAKLDWSKKPWGYFGIGLAEEIEPQQLEINRTLWTIQESLMAMGTYKVAVRVGSDVNTNDLNDEIGSIIYYTGDVPPQYLTPQAVGAEVYNHLQQTIAQAYQQAGLSQAQSTGQNPLGPSASGQAIREMEFIENDRFQTFGQSYERMHVDLGRLAVDTAHDIAERLGKYELSVSERRYLKELSLTAKDLALDDCRLEVFPVSSLPNTPAARMQTVTELVQAGWVSPRQGRRLMRFPDLEQIGSLQDAAEERIHDALETIIDEGSYTPPDSYMPLDLAKELVVEYVNLYSLPHLELEEEKLDLLYQWSDQVDYLVAKAQPPAPPMAPGAPGQPQALPQALPQSPLIRNAPGVVPAAAAA